MGSTGTGNFSDYPGSAKPPSKPGGGGAGGGGGGGGGDKCARAFTTELEDVEQSAYYAATGSLPPTGTNLTIDAQKRIVALDGQGRVVGNLPTSFNFLAECLEEGFTYSGRVTNSRAGPPSLVEADFAPNQ